MNYIYDIVLNFNRDYFNFFEWSRKDCIINIKKIPLFLIDDSSLDILKYDNVVVSEDFISLIRDKTYTYTRNKIGIACLVSNGREVIGVLFNERGCLLKRSSLTLDEEEEVLEEVCSCKSYKIDIVKDTKLKRDDVLRSVREKKSFLIKYINSEKNIINLRYLYYDYFEKDEEDIKIIRNSLIKEIKNNWNKRFNSFYDTVKIFSKISN